MFSLKIDKMEDSQRRRFHYKYDKRSENQVYISSKEYQSIYYQEREIKKKKNEKFDPIDIKSAILTQKRKDKYEKRLKKNKSSDISLINFIFYILYYLQLNLHYLLQKKANVQKFLNHDPI